MLIPQKDAGVQRADVSRQRKRRVTRRRTHSSTPKASYDDSVPSPHELQTTEFFYRTHRIKESVQNSPPKPQAAQKCNDNHQKKQSLDIKPFSRFQQDASLRNTASPRQSQGEQILPLSFMTPSEHLERQQTPQNAFNGSKPLVESGHAVQDQGSNASQQMLLDASPYTPSAREKIIRLNVDTRPKSGSLVSPRNRSKGFGGGIDSQTKDFNENHSNHIVEASFKRVPRGESDLETRRDTTDGPAPRNTLENPLVTTPSREVSMIQTPNVCIDPKEAGRCKSPTVPKMRQTRPRSKYFNPLISPGSIISGPNTHKDITAAKQQKRIERLRPRRKRRGESPIKEK